MPDQADVTTQLVRLAPEVDETAARELFERRREPQPVSRWVMPAAAAALIVAGVVGLVAVTGDDAEAPAAPVTTTVPDGSDVALSPGPGETLIAGEDHFDVITVDETTVGFGNAELVMSEGELTALWTEWNPGVDRPAVDFAGSVGLVMTRPDNACADVVTQFEVINSNDTPLWTPVFESQVDVCQDPLLSWLHVVAIERAALGDAARIRVPAAEVFDVPEQIIEYSAPARPADPERVRLDEQWERYDAQRSRFALEQYPLETPDWQCDDNASCALGYIVGESFYEVEGVTLSDELAVSGPIATLEGDASAHVLVGAEPAIYLILDSPDGRDLLVSSDLPSGATSKQRAVELRDDRCSILDVVAVATMANAACETNVVSWHVGSTSLPWEVNDPHHLSQTHVNRTEPTDDAVAEVAAALASGVDHATLRDDQSSPAAGPYLDARQLLDTTLTQYCIGSDAGTCRAGYSIDDETAGQVAATIVWQRTIPGTEPKIETSYLRTTLEEFAGAGWWRTEAGPHAVHQNGTGAEGFADAEARFASCCDNHTGDLQPPP